MGGDAAHEIFFDTASIGVFIPSDKSSAVPTNAATNPTGILGVTLAYALGARWVARALWNRVASRDDSDSGIVLVGLGYRF